MRIETKIKIRQPVQIKTVSGDLHRQQALRIGQSVPGMGGVKRRGCFGRSARPQRSRTEMDRL